jgi:hypothetical protein
MNAFSPKSKYTFTTCVSNQAIPLPAELVASLPAGAFVTVTVEYGLKAPGTAGQNDNQYLDALDDGMIPIRKNRFERAFAVPHLRFRVPSLGDFRVPSAEVETPNQSFQRRSNSINAPAGP